MKRTVICSPHAAAPIGPYSQAILAEGRFFFASGQIPLNAAGVMETGDVTAQTRAVLENVKAILTEAGATFAHVVKCTVFLADMNDFAAMNAVYTQYFGTAACPARSTIQVARLPKDARVEIEIIACL